MACGSGEPAGEAVSGGLSDGRADLLPHTRPVDHLERDVILDAHSGYSPTASWNEERLAVS